MKARAIRGVCIGPERHMALGEVADLEPPLFRYLESIGAVCEVRDDAEDVKSAAPQKPAHKEK